ncbi:hypothetical protein Tco_0824176 [Tanacetum coccineum]|uniref:Uncharacterized protein n=1 Tax=Tanacetum coccineum TaxID=301880 RepID=A0ABQ5AN10_9ASTR
MLADHSLGAIKLERIMVVAWSEKTLVQVNFLKDVNARTKKPNGMPIITEKTQKSTTNLLANNLNKKTVASESTITNSKSYYRKVLYKKTNKAWKWWIAQQCPITAIQGFLRYNKEMVLSGNYSSTEQINSIQQMITYFLITRTEKEKESEVLDCDFNLTLVTGPGGFRDTASKEEKAKVQEATHKDQCNTTSKPTKGSQQSHPVSSSTVHDPQDPERNIQLAGTGLPFTSPDEGIRAAKTTSFPEGSCGDKDSEGLKPPADMEPQTNPVADLSGTGAEYQESDEEEVFAAGDDMEEGTQADEEDHQSSSPNKDKPEPSHTLETQVSDFDSSSPDLKKYDNILPLTERQLGKYLRKATIEVYYEENVDHKDQTDKVIYVAMNSLNKNNIAKGDILNALNGLVPASKVVREDPDEPVRVPYMINGKMHYLTNDEISKHLEKEELIKKATEQARLLAITKPEVVKLVCEKAEKIGIDPERIKSAKEGEKFKKAQDAELKILNKERSKKLKNHLKSRSTITVYRITNRRTFKVHNPFSFGAFGLTELDKLREVIPKKKNVVVKDLMNSLRKRYKRIKKIHEELRIQSALPAPIPEQASSKSSGRKRKHMELELKVKVPGLDCDRSLPEGVPFVNNIVIEELEYGIFFTDVFSDQAF